MKVSFSLLYAKWRIRMSKIVIEKLIQMQKLMVESELCANARFLVLMNVSSLYWSPFHANEGVFSCNEQQKV